MNYISDSSLPVVGDTSEILKCNHGKSSRLKGSGTTLIISADKLCEVHAVISHFGQTVDSVKRGFERS